MDEKNNSKNNVVKRDSNKNDFSYDSSETNDERNSNLKGTSLENNVSEVAFFGTGEEAIEARQNLLDTKIDAAKKGKEIAADYRKAKRWGNMVVSAKKRAKRNNKSKTQKPAGRGNNKTQKYIPLDKGEAR